MTMQANNPSRIILALLCFTFATAAFADESDDLKLIEQLGKAKPAPKAPAKPKTVVEDGVEIELNTENALPDQITQLLAGFRKSAGNATVRGAIVSRLI